MAAGAGRLPRRPSDRRCRTAQDLDGEEAQRNSWRGRRTPWAARRRRSRPDRRDRRITPIRVPGLGRDAFSRRPRRGVGPHRSSAGGAAGPVRTCVCPGSPETGTPSIRRRVRRALDEGGRHLLRAAPVRQRRRSRHAVSSHAVTVTVSSAIRALILALLRTPVRAIPSLSPSRPTAFRLARPRSCPASCLPSRPP